MFEVKIHQIAAIEAIPNADAIELAVVNDYRSVVRKGQFQPGDPVVYLPEQALLPASLVDALGLTGKLAGPDKNRIKAIRLRGCLSQGICMGLAEANAYSAAHYQYTHAPDWPHCLAENMKITKWEPPVPARLQGAAQLKGPLAISYDIDNIKAEPNLFADGEEVAVTEKIHGTFCAFVFDGAEWFASSKGLLAKGFVFGDRPENDGNAYVQALRRYLPALALLPVTGRVWVLGELFGAGIQDLTYGGGTHFRLFDFGTQPTEAPVRWAEQSELDAVAVRLGCSRTPLLYRGPFSKAKMLELTDGKETVTGKGVHIREGVVVRAVPERSVLRGAMDGRVQLKSVSAAYLLRGGDTTEHN